MGIVGVFVILVVSKHYCEIRMTNLEIEADETTNRVDDLLEIINLTLDGSPFPGLSPLCFPNVAHHSIA